MGTSTSFLHSQTHNWDSTLPIDVGHLPSVGQGLKTPLCRNDSALDEGMAVAFTDNYEK